MAYNVSVTYLAVFMLGPYYEPVTGHLYNIRKGASK